MNYCIYCVFFACLSGTQLQTSPYLPWRYGSLLGSQSETQLFEFEVEQCKKDRSTLREDGNNDAVSTEHSQSGHVRVLSSLPEVIDVPRVLKNP